MYDVFYIGKKPSLFPHERQVNNIEEAQHECRTPFFWVVNYLCDYTDFNFLFQPRPWEATQTHAFGSVWQKDSGTYLVPAAGSLDTNYHNSQLKTHTDLSLWSNVESVENFDFSWHPDYSAPNFVYQFGTQWQKTGGPVYHMSGANNTKYVSQVHSRTKAVSQHICIIDHLTGTIPTLSTEFATSQHRFFGDYKNTLKRAATKHAQEEYIWIISNLCDYTNFDFSWHPETWQNQMLHVFASNEQKFGDTFFMHVPSFLEKIDQFELLEWYDLNFVDDVSVPRLPMPEVVHNEDTHVEALSSITWQGPLAVLRTAPVTASSMPTVALWRERTQTIVPLDNGAVSAIVPKISIATIQKQMYDYKWIDKTHTSTSSAPLDVVFISNGESNADKNYARLQRVCPNQIHRVSNINGRVEAYQAAAQKSTTPWFFAVFAKLEVDSAFDWNWQPDRLQQSKHYIFHARNPVTNLIYGHMAMIAYNCRLVLANTAQGLDFTLDQEHEVVPILSGVARYADDPWTAWRSAFREVIKLCANQTDIESQFRLKQWLNAPKLDSISKWSNQGAADAVAYYNSVQGDFDALKLTYEWDWLKDYLKQTHTLSIDQLCTQLQDQ